MTRNLATLRSICVPAASATVGLAFILALIPYVMFPDVAWADSRCSRSALQPTFYDGPGSGDAYLTGRGSASCSVYENRGAGGRLYEDLFLADDPLIVQNYFEEVASYHYRAASITAGYRDDGDTQEYYSRVYTYDSVYGINYSGNSSQLAVHYTWR